MKLYRLCVCRNRGQDGVPIANVDEFDLPPAPLEPIDLGANLARRLSIRPTMIRGKEVWGEDLLLGQVRMLGVLNVAHKEVTSADWLVIWSTDKKTIDCLRDFTAKLLLLDEVGR